MIYSKTFNINYKRILNFRFFAQNLEMLKVGPSKSLDIVTLYFKK